VKTGNSAALPKSSKNTKKRGNSVGSELKKSKNTWKEIEESMEELENVSWR
jgi:hypothetical protein